MARTSRIEWTDATFNPWWGCERVSPACARCYAEHLAKRWGHEVWGEATPRRFLSEQHWRAPLKWNREAEQAGVPLKVFCASMADVFEDRADLRVWRERLWGLIEETPWLAWQLLTKRPENVAAMAPWGARWPGNVWLGVSVENMRFTSRVDILREIPAALRFISAEPLLAPLFGPAVRNRHPLDLEGVDWLIAGGESGAGARTTEVGWFRDLRDACRAEGVAFFLKQLGGWPDKRGAEKAKLDGEYFRELPLFGRAAT